MAWERQVRNRRRSWVFDAVPACRWWKLRRVVFAPKECPLTIIHSRICHWG